MTNIKKRKRRVLELFTKAFSRCLNCKICTKFYVSGQFSKHCDLCKLNKAGLLLEKFSTK